MATSVTLGDGKTAKFWKNRWIGREPLLSTFPALYKHSRRKKRTVADALRNEQWLLDLQHGNTLAIAADFLRMRRLIQGTQLSAMEPDKITWIKGNHGSSSTSCAYKMQFQRTGPTCFKPLIWKPWAPAKLKMFMWLLYLN